VFACPNILLNSLVGLPPSWSRSLAEVGFTDAEIAAINARRAAARSPTFPYIYSDRPRSPAIGSIISHPSPRTTSLPRQYSDSSSPSPLPGTQSGLSITSTRNYSIESSRQACESPLSVLEISPDSDAQYIEIRANASKNHAIQPSVSSYHSSHFTRSRNSSFASAVESIRLPIGTLPANVSPPAKAPSTVTPPAKFTPPKRTFHVVNGTPSPGITSPPPAYDPVELPKGFSQDRKKKENYPSLDSKSKPELPNAQRHLHTSTDTEVGGRRSGESVLSQVSSDGKLPGKRLGALPPRLSLCGNNDDLSSWSEALLSSIPAEISTSPVSSPSQFATAQSNLIPPILSLPPKHHDLLSVPSSSPYPSPPNSQALTARPTTAPPRDSSVKTIPTILLKEYYEDDIESLVPTTARTPLWDEIMGMVQQNSPGLYMPAATESHSPTLPVTPAHADRRFQTDSVIQISGSGLTGAEGDVGADDMTNFLSADDGERDSNRDSSTSTASVSTVTAITVVRKASVAKRAVANVIRPSPVKSRDGGSRTDMQRVEEEDDLVLQPSTESSLKHLATTSGSSTASSASATGRSSNWGSPQSSQFSSESGSSSSPSQDHQTLYSEMEANVPPKTPVYLSFLESSPLPSKADFDPDPAHSILTRSGTFGGMDKDREEYTTPQTQTLIVNGK